MPHAPPMPLNAPQPATVEAVEQVNGARPYAVFRRGRWRRVTAILDEWRVDDEWWRDEVSRRYFAVVLETGERLTLFQDLITWEWCTQRGASLPEDPRLP